MYISCILFADTLMQTGDRLEVEIRGVSIWATEVSRNPHSPFFFIALSVHSTRSPPPQILEPQPPPYPSLPTPTQQALHIYYSLQPDTPPLQMSCVMSLMPLSISSSGRAANSSWTGNLPQSSHLLIGRQAPSHREPTSHMAANFSCTAKFS